VQCDDVELRQRIVRQRARLLEAVVLEGDVREAGVLRQPACVGDLGRVEVYTPEPELRVGGSEQRSADPWPQPNSQ